MERSEVIDLLLENVPTILMVIDRVELRQLSQDTNMFEEDIRTQFLDLVRTELASELYNKGLTISDLNVIIDADEFELFVEEVLKSERNQ